MIKRLSKIGWIVLAVLLCVSLVVLPACTAFPAEEEEEVPDPEMPEFEGTVLTEADIDEMAAQAELFVAAGGAQNSTILLVHDFQEVAAVLIDALDASEDGAEIPLLLDVFYAYSLSLQEAAENLPPPDHMILFSTLDEENDEFGGNLGMIKQALRDWIITEHGAPATTKAEDVFVGITPELIQEVAADLLGITSGNLIALLAYIPPSQRLTLTDTLVEPGSVIVKPTETPYPKPKVSWWKSLWSWLKNAVKKFITKVLPVKITGQILKYAKAIIECAYKHGLKWDKIRDCLVQEKKLPTDIVDIIINTIEDP